VVTVTVLLLLLLLWNISVLLLTKCTSYYFLSQILDEYVSHYFMTYANNSKKKYDRCQVKWTHKHTRHRGRLGKQYVDWQVQVCYFWSSLMCYNELHKQIYSKMAVFWVVVLCSLVEVYRSFRGSCCLHHCAMMKAARISEMLVDFYQTTRRYNPEDSHLHTHHHGHLKCQIIF
jgi:hypothetical protein